jgi:iron complex transport system ATP-binding protein
LKESLISIDRLSIAYEKKGKKILSNLNLSIEEGDVIVLLGDNGSGKSTLLKTILGILPYEAGEITLKKKLLSKWHKKNLANEVAFVGTKEVVNTYITVREFVSFGRYPFLNWLGNFTKEDEDQVSEILKSCNLDELSTKSIAEVSDGERQKAKIARAIAQQTNILILDEPTTHLDIKNSMAVFNILKEQSQRKGKTVLFSTHQVDDAVKIATKIWIINDGSIVQCSTEQFSENPFFRNILFE